MKLFCSFLLCSVVAVSALTKAQQVAYDHLSAIMRPMGQAQGNPKKYDSDIKSILNGKSCLQGHANAISFDSKRKKSLSEEEWLSVMLYVHSKETFKYVNYVLRLRNKSKWKKFNELSPAVRKYKDLLIHSLAKLGLQRYKKLYRGLGCQLDHFLPRNMQKVGSTLHFRDFLSTDKNKGDTSSGAIRFTGSSNGGMSGMPMASGTLVTITSAIGCDLDGVNTINGEKEVIILPTSSFKVVKVTRNHSGGGGYASGMDEVVLEMIHTKETLDRYNLSQKMVANPQNHPAPGVAVASKAGAAPSKTAVWIWVLVVGGVLVVIVAVVLATIYCKKSPAEEYPVPDV